MTKFMIINCRLVMGTVRIGAGTDNALVPWFKTLGALTLHNEPMRDEPSCDENPAFIEASAAGHSDHITPAP